MCRRSQPFEIAVRAACAHRRLLANARLTLRMLSSYIHHTAVPWVRRAMAMRFKRNVRRNFHDVEPFSPGRTAYYEQNIRPRHRPVPGLDCPEYRGMGLGA